MNHRFLDLKLRGVNLDPALEDKISARVRGRVSRGSLTVTVRFESAASAGGVRVDVAAARRIHDELSWLRSRLGIAGEVDLALLCSQPGVLVTAEPEATADDLDGAVATALDAAIDDLIAMRNTEGAALARDVESRLDRVESLTAELSTLATSAPDAARRRLEERLARLLDKSGVEIDPQRLAQEVAIAADRLDVTEELVRARSHIEQVRALAAQGDAVGRRLDFLIQELGREYNTVTSKSQSADIARTVVEVKAELEKIREQVQNIE